LALTDRTAARSMIGYWHDTVVCPSGRLSLSDEVYCGARGRYKGLEVVPSWSYSLFRDTDAVWCIV